MQFKNTSGFTSLRTALGTETVLANAADAYPHEDFVTTSYVLVGAGCIVAFTVLVLAFAVYCGRGERDGRADLCGYTVTVRQIESEYRTTWAPSSLFPKKTTHNNGKGSIVYRVVWIFLLLWLFMTGVFLVIAGAADTIEIYRERQQQIAAICIGSALLLCSLWIVIFRTGSLTPAEKDRCIELERAFREGNKGKPDSLEVNDFYECDDSNKKFWLELATFVLFLAWAACAVGTSQLQAWTLPGEQYGMLIFVAPGYGLLTGWLLYATSLNFGVAFCARSCPETVKAPPRDASSYTYRGSVWPIAVAFVLALFAAFIPDPTQPLPFVIAVVVFTPKYGENLAACALALLGVGVGVWNVLRLRNEMQ